MTEVKSTDMRGMLTTNINKRRGEKKTRRKNARSSPRQCIQATTPAYHQQEDAPRDNPCDLFLEALCAQTNLFWREMKINNMYTEI